jgi:dolichol-phosphate mannosyltransferase
VHHRRNFGQGRALRTGFARSRGEYVVTLDADLSYGPEYIWTLVTALQDRNVEIALASPYMAGGSVRNVPFVRRYLSRLGNLYLGRMSSYRISTSTSVVRAYRREVIEELTLSSNGSELLLEILMKAHMLGFRVCEVPARLEWMTHGTGQAPRKRTSKLRVGRAIRLYLLMGWLSRPTYVFTIGSVLVLLPGLYMAAALALRLIMACRGHLDEGLAHAVSSAMTEVFRSYGYSIAFCGLFLVVGLQALAFTLLLAQNQFYYEELFRQGRPRGFSGARDQDGWGPQAGGPVA